MSRNILAKYLIFVSLKAELSAAWLIPPEMVIGRGKTYQRKKRSHAWVWDVGLFIMATWRLNRVVRFTNWGKLNFGSISKLNQTIAITLAASKLDA